MTSQPLFTLSLQQLAQLLSSDCSTVDGPPRTEYRSHTWSPPAVGWSHPWRGIQRVSRLASGPGRMTLSMQLAFNRLGFQGELNNGSQCIRVCSKLGTPVAVPFCYSHSIPGRQQTIEWRLWMRMTESHWQRRYTIFSLKRGSLLTVHKERQVQHSIEKLCGIYRPLSQALCDSTWRLSWNYLTVYFTFVT